MIIIIVLYNMSIRVQYNNIPGSNAQCYTANILRAVRNQQRAKSLPCVLAWELLPCLHSFVGGFDESWCNIWSN